MVAKLYLVYNVNDENTRDRYSYPVVMQLQQAYPIAHYSG